MLINSELHLVDLHPSMSIDATEAKQLTVRRTSYSKAIYRSNCLVNLFSQNLFSVLALIGSAFQVEFPLPPLSIRSFGRSECDKIHNNSSHFQQGNSRECHITTLHYFSTCNPIHNMYSDFGGYGWPSFLRASTTNLLNQMLISAG